MSAILADIRREVKHCGWPQPQYLFGLSFLTEGKGEIVEIGTHAGNSLMAMATAQKIKSRGMIVHTIDIEEHPLLRSNLQSVDLLDWVDVVIGDSSDVAKSWKKQIELLWIDGDHRYEGTKSDIENWKDFVIQGGMIALHDYRDGVGVSRAVYELLVSAPWYWRCVSDREFGSIIVFERIAEPGHPPWQDRLTEATARPA